MLSNIYYVRECVDCHVEVDCGKYDCECSKCGGMLRTLAKYGKCICGKEIEFSGFTNTCDCGRDYNWSGMELSPRSCWGEETGESYSDIMIETPYDDE